MTQKKIHRFLVDHIDRTADQVTNTNKGLCHQLYSVLKIKPGEQCVLFTNGGPELFITITELSNKLLIGTVAKTRAPQTLSRYVVVAVGIPKGSLFELIVQKLTELGVREIMPLVTDRTIKHGIKLDRLQKISDEALEQSGGVNRVIIHEPLTLRKSLEIWKGTSFVCTPGARRIDQCNIPDRAILYIGPEGGWSESDELLFQTHGTIAMGLGSTVLRTETAAIVAAYELVA